MRAHASIFSANKYFQIKVLNPYRVFVDRYERDSVVVGIVGMCISAPVLYDICISISYVINFSRPYGSDLLLLFVRLALPAFIIAKGGPFFTFSTLVLYSSTSLACGFIIEEKTQISLHDNVQGDFVLCVIPRR